MRGYVDSPAFYTGVELSATDLNDIANNLILLDAASRRKPPVHYIHRTQGLSYFNGEFGEIVEGNWIWRGGFQYRVGLTGARFLVFFNPDLTRMVSSNKYQVFFDDAVVYEVDVTTMSGLQLIEIDITGLGYTDNQIITVRHQVSVVNAPPNEGIVGQIYVFDAYTYPLSAVNVGSNPTLTNFGDLTATRLNDLSNKIDYLMNRMAITPMLPTPAFIMWTLNGFGPWKQHWLSVKIHTLPNATHVKLNVYWFFYTSGSTVKITMNGVTKSYGPYNAGQYWPIGGSIEIPLSDFGVSPNTDYLMVISQEVTYDGLGSRGDRLVLTSIELTNPSEPTIITPAQNQMLESLSWPNLQTRLNSYITAANNINSTLTTYAVLWDRAQMFRARMAMDEFQDDYWATEMVHRMVRTGDVLWVKGKDVTINWGPSSSEPLKGDEEDLEIKWEHSESITSGNLEQKVVYLDQFEGLTPGTEYYITGKVHFAAEYLR